MSIKAKIAAFQIFFICIVLIMSAVVYFAIDRANYYIGRVAETHGQLQTITTLSLDANRFSEQIAEMLLFGDEGRAEFEEARRDLEMTFSVLEDLTRREIAYVEDPEEAEEEREELEVIAKMRAVVAQMHSTALELLALKRQGRMQEVSSRYYNELEEKLDDDLQVLVDLAIEGERREVDATDYQTAILGQQLIYAVLAMALAAIVASVGAVLLLSRALTGPIGRLMQGADAIGKGDLGYRIDESGEDELAVLSRHFNRMAGRVAQQQSLLGERVRERTAQLESANQRLKDLDRLRVLFLADISHELRTPLTVLRGEAEVTLRARAASLDDCRDTLERVVEQVGQMGRLVDDLLFLARSESDTIRVEPRRIRLQRDVLDGSLDEGRVLAESNAIGFSATVPDRPLCVDADPQRLRQAVLIAIDNAVKYADDGTVVEFTLEEVDGAAVIGVRNRGAGIPPEDLPYVFDRFYRGRHSRSHMVSGSGLGLAIARWIVEKHGGMIALSNLPGGLTELEIRLPLAACARPGSPPLSGTERDSGGKTDAQSEIM